MEMAIRNVICSYPAYVGIAVSALFAFPRASATGATNSFLSAAIASITSDELYEHVEVLADDVYEGRSAGSRGGRAAAQYIIQELRRYDLTPAGTNGQYTQTFDNGWRNILVLVPGDDSQLERETIVVGAHYDHVGRGSRDTSYGPIGRIHNGADDNASGVSVMLETIEAFAASGIRTRRSILFAFWDGEEQGLRGSRYWLKHPTVPADGVKLAITIDMVGRLRKGQLYVLGFRSGYGMRRLMSGPVADPLWLDFDWEVSANSDHWSFLEKRIPGALLHTGLHRDYHRPSDDAEKVNREGMREIAGYLVGVLINAANEDRLPAFRERVRRESDRTQRDFERPLPPKSLDTWPRNHERPRLGISWREDEAEPGSVFLTRVVEGTPAAAAGLKVLDRVYKVDGQSFPNAQAFQSTILAILDRQSPELDLLVERRGRVQTVTIEMTSAGKHLE
jgi:hypothetical protein